MRRAALMGLFASWAVSTGSVSALLLYRRGTFRQFVRAFGAGVLARMAVLAALMYVSWGRPYGLQASLLGAYAGGVLLMLCIEYRQFGREQL